MSMTTTPSTVLILGANGRLGAAAVQAFATAGWRVLAQVRRAPAEALPPGATALAVSMSDPAALAAAAARASVVVHAVNPVYTQWDREALPLLRQGLDVARRLGALFMLPGNVYNFGEGMPALLSESTPERPSTTKGRLRCQMEAELRAAAAQGQRSVVLRAGDFFGAGTGSWLDLLVTKDIARGRLAYPGPLDLPHAWAYLPDLAQAFVAVAATAAHAIDTPAFRALHFAGHTLTGAQLLQATELAAGELGLRPARGWRHGGMPWGVIRVGGLVVPMWRELARMSYLWRVPHALDGSALAAAVGALPASAIVPSLRQSLVDLGLAATPTRAAA
jgi:nucleoside-diphosphate-sugar epimerase